MKPETLKELLKDYDTLEVEQYVDYLNKLQNEVKKNTNKKVNPWMYYRNDELLAKYFKQIKLQGLVFDGKHITLLKTGVTFDYVAYKNKMLLAYPETIMDISIVYKGDTFSFRKENGKILYKHEIDNPFGQNEDNIIGGYCVIKNQRGEFLTLLSKDDIDKHRKVAKTDFIWRDWYKEMCLKTVSKKACKQHFEDIFRDIENLDNENYDIDQPIGITVEMKAEIEEIKTIEKLIEYFHANKEKVENTKDFNKAMTNKRKELENSNENI